MQHTAIWLSILLIVSCSSSREVDNGVPDPPARKENLQITSFSFKAEHNASLSGVDVMCDIKGNNITAFIHSIKSARGLTPSFRGDFTRIEVDGKPQTSGSDPQDFDKTVRYDLIGRDGETMRSYDVAVKVFTGLPIVSVHTDNEAPIAGKDTYVDGDMSISGIPEMDSAYEGEIGIKGRGNATWNYDKKPYKIKLGSKAPLLGLPANKHWVLLAEYCDKSLLRNACLFEMSKLAGLPWTPGYHHVELFLNDSYMGTYMLCEQVRADKERVNVDDDGFFFEKDYYWAQEPLWFSTATTQTKFTFKYPDPSDGEIAVDDANYNFITQYMDAFEAALYAGDFKNPGTGYRKYIDVDSFARWYIVQEVLGNIDTNIYFVLKSRSSKLMMYPAWDSEWSLGLAASEVYGQWLLPPAVSPVEKLYWRNNGYFGRLIEDPYFSDVLRSRWADVKPRLGELEASLGQLAEKLKYAQEQNFKRWPLLGRYVSVGLTKYDTWEEEVSYAADFLRRRIDWFDSRIEEFPN